MKVTIRTATRDDAQGIAEVHVQTWQSVGRGHFPDHILDALSVAARAATWTDLLSNLSQTSRVFVAIVDEEVCGFCHVGPSRDSNAPADVGELYSIYVMPAAHGKGLGSALMGSGVEFLKGARFKRATLWVIDGNAAARRFYEHRNWKADGASKTEHILGATITQVRYHIILAEA